MSDNKPLDQRNLPEGDEPEIFVNEYGETLDPAVVVDEPGRTVLLTSDETVVFEKGPSIDVVPVNRPRKVYGGMWGQAELITAGLATLALLTVVLLYIFLVLPATRELERNRAERARLEADLASAESKYGGILDTQTHVDTLMESVNAFEANHLPIAALGHAALYRRINGLIGAYGLTNTTGPDYVPLETLGQDSRVQSDAERGRAKYQSIYPGIYVSMTVEGSYHNIRRLIRDIEGGGDFVVVTQVELEPSETQQRSGQSTDVQGNPVTAPDPTGAQQFGPSRGGGMPQIQGQQVPPAAKGKTSGEVVSLRIEMAAYFRRPNAAPAAVQPTAQ